MDNKIAVQIGLDHRIELSYLLFDADERMRKNKKAVSEAYGFPTQYLSDNNFVLYGVDASVGSIDFVSRRSTGLENLHLVCAAITGNTSPTKMFLHEREYAYNNMYWGYDHYTACITLEELLFGIGGADVLMMDIEGMEYDILMDYNWLYKPEFLVVELHKTMDHRLKLEHRLKEVGYRFFDRAVKPKRFLNSDDSVRSHIASYTLCEV